MSTTKIAKPARRASKPTEAEPQPWLTADDAKGWTVVARGKRRSGSALAPLTRVVLDLDAEQSDWLDREVERTGVGYGELLKQLIDEKRAATAE